MGPLAADPQKALVWPRTGENKSGWRKKADGTRMPVWIGRTGWRGVRPCGYRDPHPKGVDNERLGFPRPIIINARRRLWRLADLVEWEQSRATLSARKTA